MKIMVTGGAGFIGSHFVRMMLRDRYPTLVGADVVVLDALTYAGNVANIPTPADEPRLTFVHGDITDAELVAHHARGCDVVVNFAAESHVDRSVTADSYSFTRTNVLGTHVLLDVAQRCGVVRFVQVSTDEVYGSRSQGEFEEHDPLDPSSPYAASKAAAELLVRSYTKTHGLHTVITRGANTYGPYQFPEKLIPRFITRLLRGQTVPVYGNGQHVRSWIHVDDHCRGIYQALIRGKSGHAYNITSYVELPNIELTRMILKLCDVGDDRIEWVADRPGHDYRYAIDDWKTRTTIGFAAVYPFLDGIRDTVNWYKQNQEWWQPLVARESDLT